MNLFLQVDLQIQIQKKLSEYLEVKPLEISVANSRLPGVLMVVNNHGILLPSTCSEGEFNHIKEKYDLNVEILDVKNNALGNMMSVNDKGGIVSPLIPKVGFANKQRMC